MFVMQGEVPDPFGGDSVSQGVGQIAAGRHAARRDLRQELPQASGQIGNSRESFRRCTRRRDQATNTGCCLFAARRPAAGADSGPASRRPNRRRAASGSRRPPSAAWQRRATGRRSAGSRCPSELAVGVSSPHRRLLRVVSSHSRLCCSRTRQASLRAAASIARSRRSLPVRAASGQCRRRRRCRWPAAGCGRRRAHRSGPAAKTSRR